MKKRYFSGLILPERALLSVSNVHSEVESPDGQAYARLTLNIYNNQVSVATESDEPDIYTLRNLVRSEVEFVTNVAGFLAGNGYDVEVTKVFDENLVETQVFGIDVAVLSARPERPDFSQAVNAIYPLCYGELAIYLRRCLADLSFSIKRLDDTAFYCFRALESLRHSFGHELNIDSEVDQWKAMGVALETSSDSMKPLREHAFPARHGLPRPLSDAERKSILMYTWDVVERYVDYRLEKKGVEFRIRNSNHRPD